MYQTTLFSKIPSEQPSENKNVLEINGLEEGQWIALLFDDNWWPDQVISIDKENMTLKHHFKPIAENKFKYLGKPLIETILNSTYQSLLPCDPAPDKSARFFSYDSKIASNINDIIKKL